ncbi:MAG: c-type cytochrome, partial [Pseudomonadota bacterium]
FVGKARCALCHRTWRFTDDRLHDIGLPLDHAEPQRQFKTPTLRAITDTAPYMHDGRFAGLARVVAHYNDGAIERLTLSPNLQARLNLSPAEIAALTAFLRTL